MSTEETTETVPAIYGIKVLSYKAFLTHPDVAPKLEEAHGGGATYKGLMANPISAQWNSPGPQEIGEPQDPKDDSKKTKITNFMIQVLLFDKPLEGDISAFTAAVSGSETLKYSVLAPDGGFSIVSPESIAKATAGYESINSSVKQYIAEKKGVAAEAAPAAAPTPAEPPPAPVAAPINVTNNTKYAGKIAELETKQLSPYTIEWMDTNTTALYKDDKGHYQIVHGANQDEILAKIRSSL